MNAATRISLVSVSRFTPNADTMNDATSPGANISSDPKSLRACAMSEETSPRPVKVTVRQLPHFVAVAETTFVTQPAKDNKLAAITTCSTIERLRAVRAAQIDSHVSVALTRASWWVDTFAQLLATRGHRFVAPHVTLAEQEVCMEWWSEQRKITLYFNADGVQMLKSWGADIETEMSDEVITTAQPAIDAWRWLKA